MMKPLQEKYFKNVSFPEGISNLGQHFYMRKFVSDFALEMNRSVGVALKNWFE